MQASQTEILGAGLHELSMSKSCAICAEEFNKSNKKLVPQDCCDLMACRSCHVRFLLGSDVPRMETGARCMNHSCKVAFSAAFIESNFTKKFAKQLRKHDAEVVADRERSLLPATQALATQERRKVTNKTDIELCGREMTDIRKKLEVLDRKKEYLRRGNDPDEWDPVVHAWGSAALRGELSKKAAREFKKKCPRVDVGEDGEQLPCTGFLNRSYKCGKCDRYVCKECMKPKLNFVDPEHQCHPDDVANVRLIAETTKPCPSCGTDTEKAYGCHQMWCVKCHAVWDWSSQRVLPQGVHVHNPEFLDAMRQGNVRLRAPGDMVCGGPPTWYEINRMLGKHDIALPVDNVGFSAIRMVSHMLDVETRRWQPQQDDNSDLRVDYINGNKNWGDFVFALEKRLKRTSLRTEVAAVIRMFSDNGTIQLQNAVAAETREQALEALEGLEVLRRAFNRATTRIGQRFGNNTPRLVVHPPAGYDRNERDRLRNEAMRRRGRHHDAPGDRNWTISTS